jgi:hypothetical protein
LQRGVNIFDEAAGGTIRPAINAAGGRQGMPSRRRGAGGFPVSSPESVEAAERRYHGQMRRPPRQMHRHAAL